MTESGFPHFVLPVFDGHGGYPPRLGWLHKTHCALVEDPRAFTANDATVRLGVGSSMLPALRFWSLAAKLTRPVDPARPAAGLVPTARGRWLLDDDGADPWLEDAASNWLLHWWLLAPPCRLPVWYWALGHWPFARMPRDLLRDSVLRAAAESGWKVPATTSVHRDVSCLVRMYTPLTLPDDAPRAAIEDLINSPMRELSLLTTSPDGDPRLLRTAGNLAPVPLLAYACLDYAHRRSPQPGSIPLTRLLTNHDGPGRILRIDYRALSRSLNATSQRWPELDLMGDIGTEHLTYTRPPLALAWDILDAHYGHARQRLDVHPERDHDPARAGGTDQPFLF